MTEQTLTNATTGQVVESRFAALGVKHGFDPLTPERASIVVLGWSGDGKTTWVSSIPRCLIIEFSDSAGSVVGAKAHRIRVLTWAEYDALRTLLLTSKKDGSCPYDTIAIDTGDEWFDILAEKVISDYNKIGKHADAHNIGDVGQNGAGYGDVGDLMEKELRGLQAGGFGWVFTGHLREKDVEVEMGGVKKTSTVIRPVLTQSSARHVVRMAYIKAQIIDVPVLVDMRPNAAGKLIPIPTDRMEKFLRVTTTQADEEIKKKLHHLPDRIPFPRLGAWDIFTAEWTKAVARGQAEEASLRPTPGATATK